MSRSSCEGSLEWPKRIQGTTLEHRRVLLHFVEAGTVRDALVSRNKRHMIGTGLPEFKLPDDILRPHVPGAAMSMFETSPGWDSNGFRRLVYTQVRRMP